MCVSSSPYAGYIADFIENLSAVIVTYGIYVDVGAHISYDRLVKKKFDWLPDPRVGPRRSARRTGRTGKTWKTVAVNPTTLRPIVAFVK